MISSLKASFSPSARLCSEPRGPTRFGPTRFCMRATTLRSKTIANSVITTRKTKTATTLSSTSQNGSVPKSSSVGSVARFMPHLR